MYRHSPSGCTHRCTHRIGRGSQKPTLPTESLSVHRAPLYLRNPLRRRYTGLTARFASVNEVGLLILPTLSTEMGCTHLRDYSRRCMFSPSRDVMPPKQQAALICIVVQKKLKPEIPGPVFAYTVYLVCLPSSLQ